MINGTNLGIDKSIDLFTCNSNKVILFKFTINNFITCFVKWFMFNSYHFGT